MKNTICFFSRWRFKSKIKKRIFFKQFYFLENNSYKEKHSYFGGEKLKNKRRNKGLIVTKEKAKYLQMSKNEYRKNRIKYSAISIKERMQAVSKILLQRRQLVNALNSTTYERIVTPTTTITHKNNFEL